MNIQCPTLFNRKTTKFGEVKRGWSFLKHILGKSMILQGKYWEVVERSVCVLFTWTSMLSLPCHVFPCVSAILINFGDDFHILSSSNCWSSRARRTTIWPSPSKWLVAVMTMHYLEPRHDASIDAWLTTVICSPLSKFRSEHPAGRDPPAS